MSAATTSEAIASARPKPGDHNHHAGDSGRDEAVEIGENVAVGTLEVEASRLPLAGEDPYGQQIDRDPSTGDRDHRGAADVWGREEASDRDVDDHQREHEQRRAVALSTQDLDPAEPVGHHPLSGPAGHPRGQEGDRQRGRVGDHVGGIGEQRERGDDDPDSHLCRHKRHDQAERELQCPGFARMRRAVCSGADALVR